MPSYLVEQYSPPSEQAQIDAATRRIRRAASEEQRRGERVAYVRSIVVASDETSFRLFTAESAESILRVLERAGVSFERIVQAELPEERPKGELE